MEDFLIRYEFMLPDGAQALFDLTIDGETLQLQTDTPESRPEWTQLDYHQCSNCPLNVDKQPYCPPAAEIAEMVTRFEGLISFDEIDVKVTSAERTITQKTTAQRGISAMMGLVMATSGCPHTAFFRPMARFHLPLASEEETIYRVTSMYLLAQYFRRQSQLQSESSLDGLTEIYKNMQIVNIAMAERLRSATETDSSVNAVILLDTYAQALPFVIEESLEEIRYLFTSYLDEPTKNNNSNIE